MMSGIIMIGVWKVSCKVYNLHCKVCNLHCEVCNLCCKACNIKSLLYINLATINDVQSLLQGADALALKVVYVSSYCFLMVCDCYNFCCLSFELARECLTAILYGDGITAFGVGRDVDVETYDVTCVDGFFLYGFARGVINAHQIGFVKRVEIDA